jgi:hypothetical protein
VSCVSAFVLQLPRSANISVIMVSPSNDCACMHFILLLWTGLYAIEGPVDICICSMYLCLYRTICLKKKYSADNGGLARTLVK